MFAEQGTFGVDVEVPNAAAVQMRWGPTLGSMRATLRTYPRNLEASLTILGERGTLILSGMAGERVSFAQWEGGELAEEERLSLDRATADVRARGHALVYDEWARALASGRVADATCFDALRLLDAIESSAARGAPVSLT